MKTKRIDYFARNKLVYSKRFVKDFRKAPQKVQIAFRHRLEIFLTDKYYPILNNHSLTGKYQEYRSFNVAGDWRAIFREFENGAILYFDLIGTHSQLYR